MVCVSCARKTDYRGVWTEEETERLRTAGWFVYDLDQPVRFHGVVLCPACRARDPELEKKPAIDHGWQVQ